MMKATGYIGRKMRLPELKDRPAVVIAAFGSSRRGRSALDLFDEQVKTRFSDYEIFWAYTSEFIRKKNNLPGLHQTLALVEAAGYRQAAVLPLHIFAGGEYQEVLEICEDFPGLRILTGETLMHRWTFVKEVLTVVEKEFLPAEQGMNILALHGTPVAADPANVACLGLTHLVADKYHNVVAAALEGVPDYEAVFDRIRRQNCTDRYKRIRIIPLMYLAGLHVDDDLMGEDDSWRSTLEKMGFEVECPTAIHDGEQLYKSLAFYPQIVTFFLNRLERTLQLLRYF
jgi:sirohydrochlorin cobaltochelatase